MALLRIGTKRASPAAVTPPPTTITSGLKVWTPYNLGSGAPVTLGELIAGIEAVTGKKAVIERAGKPAGDVDATYASIEKARRELAWEPRMKLIDGLATVRDWVTAYD